LPFTLSHPAAVLPLRKQLILSALVVGSMAPDFHYFVLVSEVSHFSHSIRGAFLMCLPLSLAVLWLFHIVLKRPMLSLLPASHQERLMPFTGPFRFGPWRRFLLIVLSAFVGIATHDVWDAFTHEHGWFVRQVPDLRNASVPELGDRPLFLLLQLGSTVVGLLVLGFLYWQWYRKAERQSVPDELRQSTASKLWFWGIVVAAALMGAGAAIYENWPDIDYMTGVVGEAVVACMGVTFFGALAYSAWWHLARRKSHPITGLGDPEYGRDR